MWSTAILGLGSWDVGSIPELRADAYHTHDLRQLSNTERSVPLGTITLARETSRAVSSAPMAITPELTVAPVDRLARITIHGSASVSRPGRPRSDRAQRDIRTAFREILIEEGYASLRLEHVAARAKVGKATIYRHWGSKQALAQDVLHELASPHIGVPDVGDTWSELLSTVRSAMRAVTETDFGQVIRALLS